MKWLSFTFCCLCGLLFFCGLPSASAQVTSSPVESSDDDASVEGLPLEIPPLPGARDTPARLLINDKNVALFHDLLLAPIASWLKDGKCVLKAVRGLEFLWQPSPEWKQETTKNLSRFSLDAGRNLQIKGAPPSVGFPFGSATIIDQEKDPEVKAYKILWNIQYTLAASKELLYDTELAWLAERNVLRTASGVYFRRFFSEPHAERLSHKGAATEALPLATPQFSAPNDIMLQEVLRLISPPVVFGFGQLGWRLRGANEDLLWIHSPVIGRSRQVFGSNRSDPLLGGLISFDDLFVWSGKVQSVKARVVDEKILFLPFPALNQYRLETEEISSNTYVPSAALARQLPSAQEKDEEVLTIRGYHKRSDSSSATVLWNYETGEFPRAAYWFPTTVSFVPRRVWIVEASPTDPFYSGGRRILVIDKESMLPFYKVVYGQGGDYQKLIVGGWALASSDKAETRFPFFGFVVAVDARGERAMSVTNHAVKIFPNADSKALAGVRKMLDISMYANEPKNGATSQPSESAPEPVTDEPEPKEPAPVPDGGGF